MYDIELLEYGTNEHIDTHRLSAIPRVGEFIIMEETVTETWKENFWLVRAVSYTIGGDIIIHVEKHDVDAIIERDKAIKAKLKEMVNRVKEDKNDGN